MPRRTPEQRESDNARRRERYQSDPEYVARVKEHMRQSHERHKEKRIQAMRENWPTIRERENARRRARYNADVEESRRVARIRFAERRRTYPWEQLLGQAAFRAKKKGRPFALTREWAEARWTGFCEVSGLPFVVAEHGSPGPKVFSPSIDQIRPGEGYTPDNCRFVLWGVNALKHDGSDADMMVIAKAIVVKNSL